VEQLEDLAAGLGIEVPGRFIRQQYRRLVGQGSGDGHPLAFSTGKLGWPMVHPVGDLDHVQGLPDLAEALGRRLNT